MCIYIYIYEYKLLREEKHQYIPERFQQSWHSIMHPSNAKHPKNKTLLIKRKQKRV